MDTKLTLSVDKKIVDRAKKYAQQQHISLSKLIESYLARITAIPEGTEEISPLVKSLSGILPAQAADIDFKKEYAAHLAKKY